jgi:hypothetical protein
MRHVHKGDPRDVAAYCAFLWHHGETTNVPLPISPKEWREQAKARYIEMGDDEATATECATYLCQQQDWLGGEIQEPSNAVQDDLRERPMPVVSTALATPPSLPSQSAAVKQPVEWPDDVELEAWRSTADDLLRSLPELRGTEIRSAAHLLQNAYLFASKAKAAQPCPSQGCGGDGGEALKQAAADAVKWLNSWFSNHDGNKIADKLSAALSGLEHVGKESE